MMSADKDRQTDRQTDRQADRHTDRPTDRQRDIQTDRQTDRPTGLFHHCWASLAAVGQILSKIILSYPLAFLQQKGPPYVKRHNLSFLKVILLMEMLHYVAKYSLW